MKIFKTTLISILAFAFITVSALSQDDKGIKFPEKKMAIGAVVGQQSNGGTFSFALSQQFHLGAAVGFVWDSNTENLDAQTYFVFAPYGRYFLTTMKHFNFFGQLNFNVVSQSVSYWDQFAGETKTRTESNQSFSIYFGGEWFPYSSIGVIGGIKFIDFHLDPSRFIVGIGQPFVGIEWWL